MNQQEQNYRLTTYSSQNNEGGGVRLTVFYWRQIL